MKQNATEKSFCLNFRTANTSYPKIRESARKIAEHFGVGRTQIDGILKRKLDVKTDFENNLPNARKRQKKATGNEEINMLVWKWFQEPASQPININGPLIKEKTLAFTKDMGVEAFKASNGWLDAFKNRHNIVMGTMSGERDDVKSTVIG